MLPCRQLSVRPLELAGSLGDVGPLGPGPVEGPLALADAEPLGASVGGEIDWLGVDSSVGVVVGGSLGGVGLSSGGAGESVAGGVPAGAVGGSLAGAAVPEPTSALLALVGLVPLFWRRTR